MMLNEFEVRSYGGQELAVFYGLDLMPASAGTRKIPSFASGSPVFHLPNSMV